MVIKKPITDFFMILAWLCRFKILLNIWHDSLAIGVQYQNTTENNKSTGQLHNKKERDYTIYALLVL